MFVLWLCRPLSEAGSDTAQLQAILPEGEALVERMIPGQHGNVGRNYR